MKRFAVGILMLALLSGAALAEERYKPPEFEGGHKLPTTAQNPPRAHVLECVDFGALVLAMSLATWLALRKRSRRGLFLLMLASLAYFGFYRQGCICPIGAIQNVTLAITDSTYAIPITAIVFLAVPLVFALFFGRTFCAAVCPLGMVQDFVVVKPIKVPGFLEHALGMLAFVYLAAGIFFAATGSAFLICLYDPFVGFFRLTGSLQMLVLGGLLLVIGLFVGRPYCRFLCPLGAIFRVLGPLSRRHVTVTPAECIKCRLCEDACPFNAIHKPTAPVPPAKRFQGKIVLACLVVLLPALIAAGGWGGWAIHETTARMNRDYRLAQNVERTRDPNLPRDQWTDDAKAFRASGKDEYELYDQGKAIRDRFAWGGALAGGFLGLVLGVKLINVTVRRTRDIYEPDRSRCVSCGRCFLTCPIEHVRRKQLAEAPPRRSLDEAGEGRA